MVTQGILDFFANMLAGLLGLLPPLPGMMVDMFAKLNGGGAFVGEVIAKLGVVVPFPAINMVMSWYVLAVAYWVACLAIGFVLGLFSK